MILLTQMDDELRNREAVLVNPAEIVAVEAYHYHTFRPPCGSKITLTSGKVVRVAQDVQAVAKLLQESDK
jgi:hypothetical protein